MQQSIDNKLGEIKFRKKLAEQQIENKNIFDDEFNSEDIEKIMQERMAETYSHIKKLSDQGIPISPFLEIGAERGQRSLVLENDLKASGAALDLSFDMLNSCAFYSVKFGKEKIPTRICTDAYNLPLKSNSVPFIFCYQTLHHFPDPTPIITEIHRVLSDGGTFLFDDEPYKKILHIGLYKKRHKMYSSKERKKNLFIKALDHFFAEEICNETDFGVVENDKIPLSTWKNALSIFSEKDVSLKYAKVFTTNLFKRVNLLKLPVSYLMGGTISGVCRKAGNINKTYASISKTLICPSCTSDKKEIELQQEGKDYSCKNCGRKYPEVEGVILLFKDDLFKQLYPEFIR